MELFGKIFLLLAAAFFGCSSPSSHDKALSSTDWLADIHKQWDNHRLEKYAGRLHLVFDTMKSALTNEDNENFLHGYNFIRTSLGQASAENLAQIDHAWLTQVQAAVRLYQFLEKESFNLPSTEHRELLKQAQSATGVIADISLAAAPHQGSWTYIDARDKTKHYIALCSKAPRHNQLFALYHELCHVAYQDSFHSVQLDEGHQTPDYFLNDATVQDLRATISRYICLGKKAFDTSTSWGKKVNERLSKPTLLWLPPLKQADYVKMDYLKFTEQRADLFACKALLNQENLTTLLYHLIELASSDYIIAEGHQDAHPSDFERTLYIAGFLVAHGVPLNQKLQELGTRGAPTDPSNAEASDTYLANDGARDFLQTYKQWQQDWENTQYIQWKRNITTIAQREGVTDAEKIRSLASMTIWKHDLALQEHTKAHLPIPDHEKQALYLYNLLRELLDKDRASSFENIDITWVKQY